jgi:hypothetical protein
MRFKLDENIDMRAATVLAEAGHDVATVAGEAPGPEPVLGGCFVDSVDFLSPREMAQVTSRFTAVKSGTLPHLFEYTPLTLHACARSLAHRMLPLLWAFRFCSTGHLSLGYTKG